jgi:hypothetical protein
VEARQLSVSVGGHILLPRRTTRLRKRSGHLFFTPEIISVANFRKKPARGCAEKGLDHGVGHLLRLLDDAKAPHCRKNKAFKGLGHDAAWPKVADAVIKAGELILKLALFFFNRDTERDREIRRVPPYLVGTLPRACESLFKRIIDTTA